MGRTQNEVTPKVSSREPARRWWHRFRFLASPGVERRWRRLTVVQAVLLLGVVVVGATTLRYVVTGFEEATADAAEDIERVAEQRRALEEYLASVHTLISGQGRPQLVLAMAEVRSGYTDLLDSADPHHSEFSTAVTTSRDRWERINANVEQALADRRLPTVGERIRFLTNYAATLRPLQDTKLATEHLDKSVERASASAERVFFVALGLGVLATAGLLAASHFGGRRLIARIQRLRSGATAFADGDLEHRVPLEGGDEIGEVAEAFNAMAEQLAGTQRTLLHSARVDGLTDLVNRSTLQTELENALARQSPEHEVVLLYVDLDDFKDVNDWLGHGVGDTVLRAVADRLARACRGQDVAARLGGDEFAVLVQGPGALHSARAVAKRIHDALADPVVAGGVTVAVNASIGAAPTEPSLDADTVLRRADWAMYAAKRAGSGGVHFFDAVDHVGILDRMALEHDVTRAVDDDQLELVYQPILDIRSRECLGFEALLRWHHPRLGLVPPDRFIPLAEANGAIRDIGDWVLDEATRQLVAWKADRPEAAPFAMYVNVSMRQLDDAFIDRLEALMTDRGIEPESLVLEITESAVADDVERVVARIDRLNELGIRVAVDDFGTGYSSLGQLARLPVSIVKIDRSLVSGTLHGARTQTVLEAAVGLCHRLDLDVVAEGVESDDDVARSLAAGCAMGQGFALARPASPEIAVRHLDHRDADSARGPGELIVAEAFG